METFFSTLRPSFEKVLAKLATSKVAVIGHARPDGDCIGSQVAFARILRSLGGEAICVNADVVPRRLQFLVSDLNFIQIGALPPGEWLAVFVDCADQARAGEKTLARFPKPFANFDHHLSNNGYAEHNFVEVAASATCEILAGLFFDRGAVIDRVTAQALFAGIMTDTGQFRFNSTTRRTFMLAAELVALGAHPAEIGGELYERETAGKLQLLQRFLASLKLECDGRVCVGVLPNGIFEETGSTVEDTEGMVDYARAIDGVEIGVLIEERPGAIKASLRCKEPRYRVDQVAAQFGGGGHACAAGLNVRGATLADFRSQLLSALATQIATVETLKNIFVMLVSPKEIEGVLLVDKPTDHTSHDVIARLRGKLKMKRIGHAGTLDPMATGVLVVLIGKATRVSQYLMSLDKEYTGTISLGKVTTTQDAEGEMLETRPVPPLSEAEVTATLKSFIGDQYQIPPMFSAIKIDGVPLYKKARQGEEVEREPRFIRVASFDLTRFASPEIDFVVRCSKGTYIRTIAHDVGQKIGCGAHLSNLRRTATGKFSISQCLTLDEIEALPILEIEKRLLPVIEAVPSFAL